MAKFMEWVNSNLKHNFLLLTKEQYDDIKKFWKQMINLDLTKIWGKVVKNQYEAMKFPALNIGKI